MAKKSGGQIAGDLAHLAKALYDIIKAFMQGGWGAAALQAVKHYWPQILAAAIALLMIPIIIFCCLPLMLFGFASSSDPQIATMNAQAQVVSACYDQYSIYIDEWVEEIKASVSADAEQNTETTGPADSTEPQPQVEYEIVVSGTMIQKNWFIALHAVTVGNDLNAATEADILSFARKCVAYTLEQEEENTETEADATAPAEGTTDPTGETAAPTEPTEGADATEPSEPEIIKMRLEIRYLTPEEVMEGCGFTATDKNWANLIHNTLGEGE